jgi:hypothetical protein
VARVVLVDGGHDGGERLLYLCDGSSLCVLGLSLGNDDREAFIHVAAALASSDGLDRPVGQEQQHDKQDK